MADQTIGSACTTGAGSAMATYGGNNSWCNGSTWQFPAYQFGSSALSCTSSQAGTIQWTGSSFQGCNGTSWGPIDASTSSALSSLLAATTTNSIDNLNWAQTWKWGTLTTQTALSFSTSSMTSGTLLNLADSSSSTSTGTVLSISNAETGTTYGLYSSLNGASNTGYAGYFSNSSAVGWALAATGTSYFNGNVGIGTISPAYTLDVTSTGTASPFRVYSPYGGGKTVAIDQYGQLTSSYGVMIGYDNNQGYSGITTVGNDLYISTDGGNGATNNGIYLMPNGTGTVGIGTTAPRSGFELTASGGIFGAQSSVGNTGYAGYFTNTSTGVVNYGLYASTSSSSGYAGYFQGAVNVNGALTVSSCSGCGGTVLLGTATGSANPQRSGDATTGLLSLTTTSVSIETGGKVALTVTATGSVGIGTTSPATALEIASSTTNSSLKAGSLEVQGYALNNDWMGDNIYYNGGWKYRATGYAGQVYFLNGNIDFNTIASGTAGNTAVLNTAMTILNNGNVAIGTTSPGANLDLLSTSTGASYAFRSSISGAANTGYAGYFTNSATSGVNYGVYATDASASGYGVYGYSASGIGMAAQSGGNNPALYVKGLGGNYSVPAAYVEQDGTFSSVVGLSVSVLHSDGSSIGATINNAVGGIGVEGNSTGNGGSPGIYGTTDSNSGPPVAHALTTGVVSSGVYGAATTTTGYGQGGYFEGDSTGRGYGLYSVEDGNANTGYAGYFTNTGTGSVNYGLYASTSSSSGYAGYFQGPVNVAGALTVSSCSGCGGGTALLGTATASANPQRSGDATTGLLSLTTSSVSIETGGNVALTVTATGSVGIGTTAPVAKLQVNGGAVVGNDAAACSSANAGEIVWTGSAFEGCNGSSWQVLSSVTAAYDIAIFMPTTPGAGTIARVVAERNGTFPASLTGSGCVAKTGATSATTITVNQVHSGTTTAVATISFAASGGSNQTCTFTAASTITVVPGDLIEFVFPSTPDPTLANIAITLAGSHT